MNQTNSFGLIPIKSKLYLDSLIQQITLHNATIPGVFDKSINMNTVSLNQIN